MLGHTIVSINFYLLGLTKIFQSYITSIYIDIDIQICYHNNLLQLAELRRDINRFTNDGKNGEGATDTYGENGSFHLVNLEQEYQKRLVVSNNFLISIRVLVGGVIIYILI